MTAALSSSAATLLALCVLAETGTELGFKAAASAASTERNFAVSLIRKPLLWVAIILGAGEIVLWILVLQSAPLHIAYPVISLVYVTVPAAGMLLLRERMSRRQAFGALLIAAGVACVGLSGA